MTRDWLKAFRHKRFYLMGLPVDPLSADEIAQLITQAVRLKKRVTLANVNLHSLYCATQSAAMRGLLTQPDTLCHIDGMPIVWLGWRQGVAVHRQCRLTHIDLVPPLLALCAAQGFRVAFVGGKAGHEAQNAAALTAMAPGLRLLCLHGYLDGPGEIRACEDITRFAPHLLLVGMGMPRQEEWIAANRGRLAANVIMPVGGLLDYLTGRTSTPPRVLGRLGLEWVWRLAFEPRRLAYRYLVEPCLMLVASRKCPKGY